MNLRMCLVSRKCVACLSSPDAHKSPGSAFRRLSSEERQATHFLETRHMRKFIATLIYIALAGTLAVAAPRQDRDDRRDKDDRHDNGKHKGWDKHEDRGDDRDRHDNGKHNGWDNPHNPHANWDSQHDPFQPGRAYPP